MDKGGETEVLGARSKSEAAPRVSLPKIETLAGMEPFSWYRGNGAEELSACECNRKTLVQTLTRWAVCARL